MNKKENFSQDIKNRGKSLIDLSKQSLTGYYNSLQNISSITDTTLKNTIQTYFSKFGGPKILEDNIKKIEKVLSCEDGNFMNPNFDITSTCSTCQPSFYCVNARKYQCPINTWSNSGATGCSELSKCPSGFMCTNKIQENCPTGYFCASGVSNICPKGSYCTNGNNIICPTGTYNELTGKILLSDCLRCSTGSYCTNGNRIICPTGSYCTDGIRNICPSGSYNNTTGNTGINSCMICPAGSFCADGINQICGISTWSDAGASYCQYRDKVPPGYHYDQSYFGGDYKNDTKHVKIECDPGYYCINGLRRECPINTWSEALESSSSCKQMRLCPEGNACGTKKKVQCSTGTWSDPGQSTCSPISSCPEGFMCGNLVRRQCATGTWSNSGQSTCSSISTCPAGSACGSGKRVLCATGTWSDNGATTCLAASQCPAGYYINYTNSTGTFTGGIKVLCEEGFRCSNGIKTMCPTGQFSNDGASICMICPPGSFCKNGIKKLCGTGTYSDSPGSTECKYCPIMSKTTGADGDIITRNLNVKTLNSAGAEVFQGASQCKLAEHNQSCSNTDQCGVNSSGNKLCCAYWKGSSLSSYPSGNYCADPDSWSDWALSALGKYDKCMTGSVSQVNYPYVKPGEYNYTYNTIGPGP